LNLDLSELEAGLYILSIESDSLKEIVRFVKE
jgi:hypothetical protein